MITTRWQAAVATWLMWVGLEMQTRGRLLHEWASDRYWAVLREKQP